VLSSLLSQLSSSHSGSESSAIISSILNSIHASSEASLSESEAQERLQRIALNAKKIKELKRKIKALEEEFNCAHPCDNPPDHARLALDYLKNRLIDLEEGVPEALQAQAAKKYIATAFVNHHNRKRAAHQALQQECEEEDDEPCHQRHQSHSVHVSHTDCLDESDC